jgi:predicted amidohydrolase YtcJ
MIFIKDGGIKMKKVFYNGNIHTMENRDSWVNAIFVKDGVVSNNGTSDEMLQLADSNTEKIDLEGKTVVPGFNDSHMHLMSIGMALEQVGLENTKSIEDLVNTCKDFLDNNANVKWILGRGWNQSNYPGQIMPTRIDLDKISTTKPILLRRACGHISVANTKALELAGLMEKPVEQVKGGHIDLDNEGLPTGILRERAAGLVAKLIPKFTVEDYKRHILKGSNLAVSYGLTSVQSDDLGSPDGMVEKLKAYKLALDDGLKLRINHQIRLSDTNEIDQYLKIKQDYQFPENTVTYGPLKLMTDGSLGGRTALVHAPYSDDPSTCGVSIMSQEEINEMYEYGHAKGLQLSAHAIGDKAIQKLLNAFRIVLKGDKEARPRIIHAQITNWHILEQMQEMGVVCDIQPIFVPTDMKILENRIGKARASQSYVWKTMREMGIQTAGGSDSPVESCNPILGLSAAVTRADLNDNPTGGYMPDEKLTVFEAIDLFTNGSAYAEKTEDIKGSLTKGKLADFVILSDNIFEVNPEKIKDIKVEATYISGECVYSN